MRPSWYNLLMMGGTAAAWAAWLSVVTHLDPVSGGTVALGYFFSTLFLALVGTMYLVGYLLQVRLIGRQAPTECVRASTRQAWLFATLICVSLTLQGWRLLTWYNAILLIALLTFIELLFISRQRRPLPAANRRLA